MNFDSLMARVSCSQIIPSPNSSLYTVYITLDNGFEYSQVFRSLYKEDAPADLTQAYSNMLETTLRELVTIIEDANTPFAEEFINYEHVYQGLQLPVMV
jgi:hypothetical protein